MDYLFLLGDPAFVSCWPLVKATVWFLVHASFVIPVARNVTAETTYLRV